MNQSQTFSSKWFTDIKLKNILKYNAKIKKFACFIGEYNQQELNWLSFASYINKNDSMKDLITK